MTGLIGLSESAVIINEEVLDSLGPGLSSGPGQVPPGDLLHPPTEFPKSRLLVPAPAGSVAATAAAPSRPQTPAADGLQSRLPAPIRTEAGPPDLPTVEAAAAPAAPQASATGAAPPVDRKSVV